MNLTDVNTICGLLSSYGIKPTKAKGQNFLVDAEVLAKIVQAADLGKDDLVVEIGPGSGVLTSELARRAKKVLAVELDKAIIKVLGQTLKEFKNVEILSADILAVRNQELFDRLGGSYKVVANIPYNITGKIIRKFLTYEPRPQAMVLMTQKEVAKRLVAPAGQLSLIGVAAQFYGRPELIATVGSQSFYPEPAVDSAVVKIILDKPKINVDEKKFWQLVKIGFSSRRKQLQNNLVFGLKKDREEIKNALIKANLNPQIRAQDLTVADWEKLVKIL